MHLPVQPQQAFTDMQLVSETSYWTGALPLLNTILKAALKELLLCAAVNFTSVKEPSTFPLFSRLAE